MLPSKSVLRYEPHVPSDDLGNPFISCLLSKPQSAIEHVSHCLVKKFFKKSKTKTVLILACISMYQFPTQRESRKSFSAGYKVVSSDRQQQKNSTHNMKSDKGSVFTQTQPRVPILSSLVRICRIDANKNLSAFSLAEPQIPFYTMHLKHQVVLLYYVGYVETMQATKRVMRKPFGIQPHLKMVDQIKLQEGSGFEPRG